MVDSIWGELQKGWVGVWKVRERTKARQLGLVFLLKKDWRVHAGAVLAGGLGVVRREICGVCSGGRGRVGEGEERVMICPVGHGWGGGMSGVGAEIYILSVQAFSLAHPPIWLALPHPHRPDPKSR